MNRTRRTLLAALLLATFTGAGTAALASLPSDTTPTKHAPAAPGTAEVISEPTGRGGPITPIPVVATGAPSSPSEAEPGTPAPAAAPRAEESHPSAQAIVPVAAPAPEQPPAPAASPAPVADPAPVEPEPEPATDSPMCVPDGLTTPDCWDDRNGEVWPTADWIVAYECSLAYPERGMPWLPTQVDAQTCR